MALKCQILITVFLIGKVLYFAVMGVKSAVYHAGLSMPARKKAHHDFIMDEIQVFRLLFEINF